MLIWHPLTCALNLPVKNVNVHVVLFMFIGDDVAPAASIPCKLLVACPCPAAAALLTTCLVRRSCNPLDIQQLTFPGDLWFVMVNPVYEAPTAEMRAVLPKQVAMSSAVHNCAMGGSLVRPCCLQSDLSRQCVLS